MHPILHTSKQYEILAGVFAKSYTACQQILNLVHCVCKVWTLVGLDTSGWFFAAPGGLRSVEWWVKFPFQLCSWVRRHHLSTEPCIHHWQSQLYYRISASLSDWSSSKLLQNKELRFIRWRDNSRTQYSLRKCPFFAVTGRSTKIVQIIKHKNFTWIQNDMEIVEEVLNVRRRYCITW